MFYLYLAGKLFHEIQVKLYAEYDRNLLLPFLRQSNYYPLAKALQVCEDKQLYPEMVFLMGRWVVMETVFNI